MSEQPQKPYLPTQPAALLRLAVKEARKLDRNLYKPEAGEWHSVVDDPPAPCMICFAGAVIAGKLLPYLNNAQDYIEISPHCFPEYKNRLLALDSFRTGYVHVGLARLGYADHQIENRTGEALCTRLIKHRNFYGWYEFDKFLEEMEHLADWLSIHAP